VYKFAYIRTCHDILLGITKIKTLLLATDFIELLRDRIIIGPKPLQVFIPTMLVNKNRPVL